MWYRGHGCFHAIIIIVILFFLGKFRLLLRREQVLKIACNHYLTLDINLKPMNTSETAWCWFANDFSEGTEGQMEQFAVKFKVRS